MRTKKGIITSTKMNKTVVVTVDGFKTHEKYGKRYKVSTKYYAHDENNACKEGDVVVIKETRPYSRTKRWIITQE